MTWIARMFDWGGRWLSRRHGGRIASQVDHALMRLHRGYENLNYDPTTNGERWVLERLAEQGDVAVIFDVGANIGEWALPASDLFPMAVIDCFEIVPSTHELLAENLDGRRNVRVHGVGLSDRDGETEVNYVVGGSGVATLVDGMTEEFFGVQTEKVSARITSGDVFCTKYAIDRIDFLKLDVEGSEWEVLRGFASMLSRGAINVVQFEYGYVNVLTKHLLRDFHQLLEEAGMVVGKIYPNQVDFQAYRLTQEDFLGPNYLAVSRSQERLIAALSGRRGVVV